MRTEIHLVGGESVVFEEDATVKMSDHGVEVVQIEGDEKVKVLFPWGRIEKVTQRGTGVSAVYTF
jgi:hypothetical protein